jgi:hypothetical protein
MYITYWFDETRRDGNVCLSSNSTCSICCGFAVDLLIVQLFDLLWTSRKPYSTVSIHCGFAVESTTNPQHVDMSRCCGFVEKLWICCTTCATNPQQIEQVDFELYAWAFQKAHLFTCSPIRQLRHYRCFNLRTLSTSRAVTCMPCIVPLSHNLTHNLYVFYPTVRITGRLGLWPLYSKKIC